MFQARTLIITSLRPTTYLIKQARNVRPSLKISKEKVELSIDVRNFNRDEIRVKARPEYVIIEGKQEVKSKTGFIVRQFVRKFKLPEGCRPKKMTSQLSPDGMLTITAHRIVCEPNFPCEVNIPISFCESKKDDLESTVPIIPDKDKTDSETPKCDEKLKPKKPQ